MYVSNIAKSSTKKIFATLVALALGTAALVVPAQSASANVPTSVSLRVLAAGTTTPIPNSPVKYCDYSSWPGTCVTGNSDQDGLVTLNISIPTQNSQIMVTAGGPTTGYSLQTVWIQFTNGVAPVTDIELSATTWIDLVVNLQNGALGNAPINNESVQISTSPGTATSSAITNSSGQATYRVDNREWGGSQVITASVGGNMGSGTYETASATLTVTGSTGSVTLVTQPLNYTLSGSVTFASVAVTNRAMSVSFFQGSNYVCRDFVTDSSGNYSVPNVGSRNPSVNTRSCSDYSPTEFDWVSGFSYNSNSVNQTFNIVLTKTGVDLTVRDAATSSPIANLEVRLTSTTQPDSYATATTDQSGVAHFVGLQQGATYRASYVRNQYNTNALQLFEEKQNSSTVTVGNIDSIVTDLLTLSRLSSAPATPVTVSGRVVTGVNNTAVANATINLSWNNQTGINSQYLSLTTRTDSQGNYSFTGLPYGHTSLSVSAAGFRQTYTYFNTSAADGNSYNRGSLNLRPTPRGDLSYEGVLLDASSHPIVGMQLYLYGAGTSGSPAQATTANDGSFQFSSLAEGIYYLSANTWSSDSIYLPLSGSASFVDLTTSRTGVTLTLSSRTVGNATVSGHVAEYQDVAGESSATPLASKTVRIWPKNGGQGYEAVTDSDGSWSISGLPENQQYYVYVEYDYRTYEYPHQTNYVTAKSSGGVPHSLLLKKITPSGTGSLSGRVKDSSDYSNLEGIHVSLYRNFGGVNIDPVTTDSRGEYSFSNLPAGEYFLVVGDNYQSYKDAYMSVEIGTGANRINALLSAIGQYPGTISGTILDDRGVPLHNASVEAWSRNDSTIGGYAQTDSEGKYSLEGLPAGVELNFRVTPTWDLRYEVSSYNRKVTLDAASPSRVIDVQLAAAAFVTGTVSGIPTLGNVPVVAAELIDTVTNSVSAVTYVSTETGLYTFASVPAGNYIIRFTQRANYEGYTGGGGGFGFGGTGGEVVSLKPVYWDGTTLGTENKAQAQTIAVLAGARISGKSVTVSRGSSITGTVLVETPDGVSRLTGTRSVLVYIYQKQADGSWDQIGYPEGVNGYTNSEIQIAGLSAGRYKLKFEDSRRGNNSLATTFNGGATTLALAPEIVVGDTLNASVSQVMSVAPPERSASAFDLDDLGQAQLDQLQGQITVSSELSTGSEEPIYVGVEFAGEYVSAFANSTPTNLGGWKQVDSNGYISVVIPADFVEGSHRIAVQDANLKVIGWSAVTVGGSATEESALSYTPKRSYVTPSESTETSAVTKPTPSKSSVSASEVTSVEKTTAEVTNNIWLMYVLGAALLLGIAGAIWLLRSRKS